MATRHIKNNCVSILFNKQLILAFFLSFFFPHVMAANQVQLNTSVDTTVATVGDHINYKIVINHNKSQNIKFPADNNFKPFKILEQETNQKSSKNSWISTEKLYTITTFDTGIVKIPALEIQISSLSDTTNYLTYKTKAISINIVSVLPQAAQQVKPKDIKGPFTIPTIMPWDIIIFVIVVIILSLGSYISWRWWKKKQAPTTKIKEEYLQPPHIVAFQKLKNLRKKTQLDSKTSLKNFYFQLSEILRGYIERRFFVYALEMSTSEILAVVDDFDLELEQKEILKKILTEMDMVKYANYGTTSQKALEIWETIYSWIESTKHDPIFSNRSGLTETLEEIQINK